MTEKQTAYIEALQNYVTALTTEINHSSAMSYTKASAVNRLLPFKEKVRNAYYNYKAEMEEKALEANKNL